MKYYGLSDIVANFVNGENVVVQGATSNTGKVIQTVTKMRPKWICKTYRCSRNHKRR